MKVAFNLQNLSHKELDVNCLKAKHGMIVSRIVI